MKTLYKMKILSCQILRVSMKGFCEPTESRREFIVKKSEVRSQLWKIFNYETKCFLVWLSGLCFPQTTCYVEEKQEETSKYTANAKISTFT